MLGRLARSRWAGERAAATGSTPEEAQREGEAFEGAAADRRARELSRISAALKREVARGEHAGRRAARPALRDGPRARAAAGQARRRRRAARRVPPPCLAVGLRRPRRARRAARNVHVIGLTATPPIGLPEAEAELYDALLGPVDFTVPTPAVVRDGHLAPYQELAWLTEPLSVRARMAGRARQPLPRAGHDAARRRRERDLLPGLGDRAHARPPPLARRRRRGAVGGVPEALAQARPRRHPLPALRRAASADRRARAARPTASPRTSTTGSCCSRTTRCAASRRSGRGEAGDRYDAISAALRELGFQLTRKGIRRGTSEVDRLLTGSQAKALGLVEVLSAEADTPRRGAARARAVRRRAGRPAPRRRAHRRARPRRRHGPPRAAGDRRRRAHRADAPAARLRPRPALRAAGRRRPAGSAARRPPRTASRCPSGRRSSTACSSRCSSQGAEWMPRAWVELATTLLIEGTTSVLVGTRALLGEGWNCPPLNVLVDMTIATTGVSVQQMRGRTLRLDPGRPAEGRLQLGRRLRRARPRPRDRATTSASCASTCTCSRPPRTARSRPARRTCTRSWARSRRRRSSASRALNAAQLARSADRDAARERWQIGTPYRGVELPTLLVRRARRTGSAGAERDPGAGAAALPARPDRRRARRRGGVRRARRRHERAAAAGRARARARRARLGRRPAARAPRSGCRSSSRSTRAARAVAEAYRELGELTAEAAASLTIEPRAAGYLRCELTQATPAEGKRFAAALDELRRRLRRAALPRLAPARRSAPRRDRAARPRAHAPAAVRRAPAPRPADLARNKERAEAFARAWRRHVGPGRLVFTQRSEEGREARAEAASADGGYETLVRDVWV